MMDEARNTSGTAAHQCGTTIATGEEEKSRSGERRSQGWHSRGYLPHFDSPHVIQHITYRLADSLPRAALEKMQAEIAASGRDDEKRKSELRQRIEVCLDAGYGSCVLREPVVAGCIVDTWRHFDGDRYRLLEWVVMPNHCHVLIEPFEGVPLGKIVLSWKNYTARFINEYRRRTGVRRSREDLAGVRRFQEDSAAVQRPREDRSEVRRPRENPAGEKRTQVWHREYWDRFIRNERHFEAAKHYIAMNPVNAGLAAKPEDWPWGSAMEKRLIDDKAAKPDINLDKPGVRSASGLFAGDLPAKEPLS